MLFWEGRRSKLFYLISFSWCAHLFTWYGKRGTMVDVPFEEQVWKGRETTVKCWVFYTVFSRAFLSFALSWKTVCICFSQYSSGIIYDQVFNRPRNRRKIEEACFCYYKAFCLCNRDKKNLRADLDRSCFHVRDFDSIYVLRVTFRCQIDALCQDRNTLGPLAFPLQHDFQHWTLFSSNYSLPCNNSKKCCNSKVDLLFMFS